MKTAISLTILFVALMAYSAFLQIMPLMIIFFALAMLTGIVYAIDEHFEQEFLIIEAGIDATPDEERELESWLYKKGGQYA